MLFQVGVLFFWGKPVDKFLGFFSCQAKSDAVCHIGTL